MRKVVGIEPRADESWIGMATPSTYWEALGVSYRNSESQQPPPRCRRATSDSKGLLRAAVDAG